MRLSALIERALDAVLDESAYLVPVDVEHFRSCAAPIAQLSEFAYRAFPFGVSFMRSGIRYVAWLVGITAVIVALSTALVSFTSAVASSSLTSNSRLDVSCGQIGS